jgi:hypothetical protein
VLGLRRAAERRSRPTAPLTFSPIKKAARSDRTSDPPVIRTLTAHHPRTQPMSPAAPSISHQMALLITPETTLPGLSHCGRFTGVRSSDVTREQRCVHLTKHSALRHGAHFRDAPLGMREPHQQRTRWPRWPRRVGLGISGSRGPNPPASTGRAGRIRRTPNRRATIGTASAQRCVRGGRTQVRRLRMT